MKKKIIALLICLSIIGCNFKSIYHGGSTKYKNLTDVSLIELGDSFQNKLAQKKDGILTKKEKNEYDNILIEAISRAYKKRNNSSEDQEIFYSVLKEIKNLKTIKEYDYFIFYNENLNYLMEKN